MWWQQTSPTHEKEKRREKREREKEREKREKRGVPHTCTHISHAHALKSAPLHHTSSPNSSSQPRYTPGAAHETPTAQ
jgi:hypothetical protein